MEKMPEQHWDSPAAAYEGLKRFTREERVKGPLGLGLPLYNNDLMTVISSEPSLILKFVLPLARRTICLSFSAESAEDQGAHLNTLSHMSMFLQTAHTYIREGRGQIFVLSFLIFKAYYSLPSFSHSFIFSQYEKLCEMALVDPSTSSFHPSSFLGIHETLMRGVYSHSRQCIVCGVPLPSGKTCSRCMDARYYNEVCQKKDWPTHKRHCGRIKIAERVTQVLTSPPPGAAPPSLAGFLLIIDVLQKTYNDPDWTREVDEQGNAS